MKKEEHPYDSYFRLLTPFLDSKVEELKVLGYKNVSKSELWEFLKNKKWKKPQDGIRIYKLVADIMSIKVGDYMNYATVESFRTENVFSGLTPDELQELLK